MQTVLFVGDDTPWCISSAGDIAPLFLLSCGDIPIEARTYKSLDLIRASYLPFSVVVYLILAIAVTHS